MSPLLSGAPPPRPRLQAKFTQQHQALIHGDLHTGSIMATGAAERRRALFLAVAAAAPPLCSQPAPPLQPFPTLLSGAPWPPPRFSPPASCRRGQHVCY